LYTRVVVAIEWRHFARTPGFDRVCGIGKPHPEMVHLDCDWDRSWVQDEGLITEDPSHVYDTSAIFIGR
jgi:hypothetical protein